MKYDLSRKLMTKLATSRPKTYSYLIDDGNENKK